MGYQEQYILLAPQGVMLSHNESSLLVRCSQKLEWYIRQGGERAHLTIFTLDTTSSARYLGVFQQLLILIRNGEYPEK